MTRDRRSFRSPEVTQDLELIGDYQFSVENEKGFNSIPHVLDYASQKGRLNGVGTKRRITAYIGDEEFFKGNADFFILNGRPMIILPKSRANGKYQLWGCIEKNFR